MQASVSTCSINLAVDCAYVVGSRGKGLARAYGLPNISFIGYPVSIPCAGHAGLGLREARRRDSSALVAHLRKLEAEDRRMRFCATLTDQALERHVEEMWSRDPIAIAALDGPLWLGPLNRAGEIRAFAEVFVADGAAELGLSVDPALRQRGVGTYLVQTAAHLLARRGARVIRASTLPDNRSFLTLARACGARIDQGRRGRGHL